MPSAIGRRALRQIAVVVALVLLLPIAALGQTTRLTFLHTNDTYEIVPAGGWGGFAQLMTVLKEQRATSANSLTTFGGDLLSPSIMSSFHRGAQMIELMNAVGTDIAVLATTSSISAPTCCASGSRSASHGSPPMSRATARFSRGPPTPSCARWAA
jgi:hypothetical protein